MNDGLKRFLQSRNVPNDDILRMQRDKIDMDVLLVMSDDEMKEYIPSYGDRVAVSSYCRQHNHNPDKEAVLERLRSKIGSTRKKKRELNEGCDSRQREMSREGNASAIKKTRKIEIGWLNFVGNDYRQVRTKCGGGTRQVNVDKSTTVQQVLKLGKDLFFPQNASTKGRIEDFTFEICDFKRKPLCPTNTVGQLYDETKLGILRFYICTKETPEQFQCENPAQIFSRRASNVLTSTSTMNPTSPSSTLAVNPNSNPSTSAVNPNSNSSISAVNPNTPPCTSAVNPNSNPSTSAVNPNTPPSTSAVNPTLSPRTLAINPSTSAIAQNPLPSASLSSDSDQEDGDCLIVNKSKILKRKRKSKTVKAYLASFVEEQALTDNSDYDGESTILWDPEHSETSTEDSSVVIVNILGSKETMMNPSHVFEIHIPNEHHATSSNVTNEQTLPDDHLEGAQINLRNDVPSQSSATDEPQISENLQASQITLNSGTDSSLDELPVDSGEHTATSDLTEASVDQEIMQHVTVRRVLVVRDLVEAFMDKDILRSKLKMKFVNEIAVDDAGVSREVYTVFWEQFLELCEGETERVPRLAPNFGEAEWGAVGRIWVKGLLDHGVVPVMLSQSFILASIHGIDSVDDDDLIASFLNFLSPIEKSVVERALQGSCDHSDEEDLLDIFSRMGSHKLPAKEGLSLAIKTMAHKAILQEAKYVIDCFSTQMVHVKVLLPNKQSIKAMYRSKQASGRKVSQLFEPSQTDLTQKEQVTFDYLQRYAKNADQAKAEKLLRFCTGSSVIAVDKIIVSFNKQTGLNRRPVSHTCGAMLELPCTYSSYPDFRTELDNVLTSNFWQMDFV